jgi:archaellum component FlaC
MTEQDFQKHMIEALSSLNHRFDRIDTRFDGLETRFDGLEKKVDGLETRFDLLESKVDGIAGDLTTFKTNQEDFNSAIWAMNTQAFDAITEISREVVSPWKRRQAKSAP